MCIYVCELLVLFTIEYKKLYGQDMLVYNVHNFVHLASDVEQLSPLDDFSASSFESLLGDLKVC